MKKHLKIALCVSGLMRDAKKSFMDMKDRLVIDGVDIDLFIHTWGPEDNFKDDKWGINAPEVISIKTQRVSSTHFDFGEVSQSTDAKLFSLLAAKHGYKIKIDGIIKTIDEILPVTEFKLERVSVVQPELDEIKERFGPIGNGRGQYKQKWSPHNLSCWLYSLYMCNHIKNKYTKRNNIEYDLVIRSRTELTFTKTITIDIYEQIKKKNLMGIPSGGDSVGLNDMFAIGRPDAIDWYCSIKDHYVPGTNPHQMFKKHLSKQEILRFDMPMCLRNRSKSG